MSYLALVRHGESRWNLSGKFTGWVDVPLSKNGVREAERCARQLKGINFDMGCTSNLERARATLLIILSQQNRTGIFLHNDRNDHYRWTCASNRCAPDDIPIHTSEALNERYYGRLQGLNKGQAERRYGAEQVRRWRRGYADRPPGGESLQDAFRRIIPYYRTHIERALRQGQNVLLAAHGNTLRAIIKHIERIADSDIPHLDLPAGKHILYRYQRGQYSCLTPGVYRFDRPLR